MVDTHLHLLELPDPAEAAAEALAAGVSAMLTMGHDLESSRGAVAAADRYPGVFAGAGHHASSSGPPDLEAFAALLTVPQVVAVGEVGLDIEDGEDYAPLADQVEWFDAMIELAIHHRLPLSVHVRGTERLVYERLRAHPGAEGAMHYFALDQTWATRFLDLGFYLSFAGLVTRASRDQLRAVARACPLDRLLLETDAPWGKPAGRRKETHNRPAFIWDTARLVADLRGIPVDELAAAEAANARRLFSRLP